MYTNTMRVILEKEIQYLNNCLVRYVESDIFDSVDNDFFTSLLKYEATQRTIVIL